MPRFSRTHFAWLIASLLVSLITPASFAEAGDRFEWKRVVINADSDFEAAGVADFNNDGALDIMCGDTWYEGPAWTPHSIGEIDEEGGYRIDFSNVPMDVNGDGWIDVVSCNWHRRSVLWRENPGAGGGPWSEHAVDTPGNMETAIAVDVDRDGRLDFLPNVMEKTIWYRVEEGKLVGHEVSAEIGGHGIGLGDVNGDGRADLLNLGGWFEAPADPLSESWTWHPEWNLGSLGIAMIAHDFTGDGLADVFAGMGHDYGTFWLEQTSDPEKKWLRHEIDNDWSQAHAIRQADLDGDGLDEIVTGKRKYAHNGNDPGGEDPMIIYVYRFDRASGSFEREIVHEGGDDGVGLAPVVIDVDADGDLDLVAPGKSGLYLYLRETSRSGTDK